MSACLKGQEDSEPETHTDDDEGIKPAPHPGRPPGSKNKKTLAKEAAMLLQNGGEQAPKRGPGRPPGSKNKKTLEKEAAGQLQVEKRKPGRPFGSKDKAPRKRRTKQELMEARAREGFA